MAYKIIYVHGGKFEVMNNNWFVIKTELPKIKF